MRILEIALNAARKRRQDEERARKAVEASRQALVDKRARLESIIRSALDDLRQVLEVHGRTVQVGDQQVEVFVQLIEGYFCPDDGSPAQDHEDWLIYWKDSQGKVYGAVDDEREFHQQFGKFISQYM